MYEDFSGYLYQYSHGLYYNSEFVPPAPPVRPQSIFNMRFHCQSCHSTRHPTQQPPQPHPTVLLFHPPNKPPPPPNLQQEIEKSIKTFESNLKIEFRNNSSKNSTPLVIVSPPSLQPSNKVTHILKSYQPPLPPICLPSLPLQKCLSMMISSSNT